MPRIFISNSKVQYTENDIVFDPKIGIGQLFAIVDSDRKMIARTTETTVNNVYVIDVHCTFKGAEKMQQQGGLIIYRQLLKLFEGEQDKLKVVFYSPIAKEDLVKLKPENYILKLLPFIECQYKEGQFERELSQIISNNKFPQFNNASENLLSGWSLVGQKKITSNKKKILFIDDQQSEWKEAFSQLFESNTIEYLNVKGQDIDSQREYRSKLISNFKDFVSLTRKAVENKPDLILSDFYLEENHDITKWKDVSEIQKVSGYKLFNQIRLFAPSTPYIFHTSSNKASIYKFFDNEGVDDWLVKDIRTESNKEEKKENFEVFKDTIERYLKTANYKNIKNLWDDIDAISLNPLIVKLKPNEFNDNKENIISILKYSWMALRRLLNREEAFEQAITGVSDFRTDSFTSTAICNNLGKILEILKCSNFSIKNRNQFPKKESFLIQIRHEASHSNEFNEFRIEDAIIYFFVLFACLKNEFTITKDFKYNFHKLDNNTSHPYSLFWQYIQFYNETINLNTYVKQIIQFRLKQLFEKYYQEDNFKELLSKNFNGLIQPSISNQFDTNELEFKNNKCSIKAIL